MSSRGMGCALLVAAILLLSATSLHARGRSTGRLKFGASGQVYVWQAGTC